MIYIAGPFFNDVQIDLIAKIEESLTDQKVPFFSPRLESKLEGKLDREKASEIFEKNIDALVRSTHIIAVLDWLLHENEDLLIQKTVKLSDLNTQIFQKILNLPDSGTVWEMGFARTMKIPIFGFYNNIPKAMNLMLTQTCDGFLDGVESVKGAFRMSAENTIEVCESHVGEWQGGYI